MSRLKNGELSDRTAGLGIVSDRTANLGEPSDRIAGLGVIGDRTAECKSHKAMQPSRQHSQVLYSPTSDKDGWVKSHTNRAKVIGLYGEAFKKFDWLFYIIAAFFLFILSLLAAYFLGTVSASVCTLMGTAALILLRKKTG